MFYGMIEALGTMYTYLTKARGRCSDQDIKTVAIGALTMADNAEHVVNPGFKLGADDLKDLDEVKLIRSHIEEMMVFQLSQEIV